MATVPRPTDPVNVLVHIIVHALQTEGGELPKRALRVWCRQYAPAELRGPGSRRESKNNGGPFSSACDRVTAAGWAERVRAAERGSGVAVLRLTSKGKLAHVWNPEAR